MRGASDSFWSLYHDDILWIIGKLLLLVMLAVGVWSWWFLLFKLGAQIDAKYAANVAQCMRAFEYTRDQCEFIIRNHVVPR